MQPTSIYKRYFAYCADQEYGFLHPDGIQSSLKLIYYALDHEESAFPFLCDSSGKCGPIYLAPLSDPTLL